MSATSKLISIASNELSESSVAIPGSFTGCGPQLMKALSDALSCRNGFFAFEGALHVFPSGKSTMSFCLEEWNSDSLWRAEYGGLANGSLFFAEDAFGIQFCIRNNAVHSFDPETGNLEQISDSLDGWAAAILNDYEFMTGYPLAHQWQLSNGAIPSMHRLIPKVPFILGGEYSVSNLFSIRADAGMRFRGDLARQLRHAKPGTQVEFKFVP